MPRSTKAKAGKSPAKKSKGSGSGGGIVPDRRMLDAILAMVQAEAEDMTPLAAAQDIAWEAWDTDDRRKRLALARKALKISPLCADAYVILAEDAKTVEEGLALCRQGVEAGEKALGKHAFHEDVGDFWGILETRPYMRARHGLAMRLWETGAREEAVAHYGDMLRLNPGDNQGIRYLLLDCLLVLGRDDEAEKLLRRYRNDGAAAWMWSAALACFRREGNSAKARKALQRAADGNVHVAGYLLGRKKLPRTLPAYISVGGEDEAIAYVADSGAEAWAAAPGALEWVAKVLG
ncbi:MAG TPA: tetratricopeptide repeat protein [Rhizomicrobium sp.]|nr:tetratricopeptide repeat protein [Rhizomicrobium sp.]